MRLAIVVVGGIGERRRVEFGWPVEDSVRGVAAVVFY